MKYVAFAGTYNEQYYDTQTRVLSYKEIDTITQCDKKFRPDLKATDIKGIRIWTKKDQKLTTKT